MHTRSGRVAALLFAGLVAFGAAGQIAPAADQPLLSLPYTPSLDLSALDRTVDPCEDLYAFSCGGWIRQHPIPADQSRWNVYSKLESDNEQFLWGMLEKAAKPNTARSAAQQRIGDYFAACMDEVGVERAGIEPIRAELELVAKLQAKRGLGALLGRLHLSMTSSRMLFGFGSDQDLQDSSQVIAYASAGGLGLPDRDYYLKIDADSRQLRAKYTAHVRRMLVLAGEKDAEARLHAEAIVRIERALALKSLTRVERRDPRKLDHKLTFAQLQRLTPSFAWSDYFAATGLAQPERLNVTEPEFYRGLEHVLMTETLPAIKTYLRWHLVSTRAPYLSSPLAQAGFDFYGRTLRGAKAQEPRWKRCVQWVDRDLGEALGQVFVEQVFSADTKARTLDMVERIESAMNKRLERLSWMSADTKQQARAKLASMRNKIGYPERWRDYGALELRPADFMGNVRRAIEFESKRQLDKIGAPLDRGEWTMTPPTVNAYYSSAMNDMNFPAGVLQPPLFDPKSDDAPNYGNTGGTIGHELIHGFDDEGRRFDAQGNLKDWWTEADGKQFERRAQCIVDQYAKYTVIDDVKINSRLTLGEDVADLAGLILAWDAWKDLSAAQTLEARDGFTPEQRFFIGFAQWDCGDERPESMRLSARTNPHSPSRHRIDGVVVNMPEFGQAFACKPGQAMVKDPVCRIW